MLGCECEERREARECLVSFLVVLERFLQTCLQTCFHCFQPFLESFVKFFETRHAFKVHNLGTFLKLLIVPYASVSLCAGRDGRIILTILESTGANVVVRFLFPCGILNRLGLVVCVPSLHRFAHFPGFPVDPNVGLVLLLILGENFHELRLRFLVSLDNFVQ